MRRLLPPHLEGWRPARPDTYSVGEEHHLLSAGAVLLLDAEGSTALSARLRAKGTLSAAPLETLLEQIFATTVDAVADCGGYVGHFTGDGVIAVFPGERHAAVENAVSAAQTILAHLDHVSGVITPAGPVDLAVRAVIGAGTIDTFVWRAPQVIDLGRQNAAYVIVGTALTEAHFGELLVEGGALGIGPTAAAALPQAGYFPLADGYVTIEPDARVTNPASTNPHRPPAAPMPLSPIDEGWRFAIPAAYDDDVPAEFRQACVLFLELRQWPHEDIVAAIIEHVARSGGHISNVLRTSFDQLGITFMLVWGAPVSREDDARAALLCVEAVQQEVGIDAFRTGAVASSMFTGIVGSDTQATYTVVGAPVNLAARLCSLATWGEIRVIGGFDAGIPSDWTVEQVEARIYKGFSMPLETRSLRPPHDQR